MYTLTLTSGERRAFDWVGGRHSNGDETAKLIMEGIPEDREWSDDGDITFSIPEHVAWEIKELADSEDGRWTSFDRTLSDKMQRFIDNIV